MKNDMKMQAMQNTANPGKGTPKKGAAVLVRRYAFVLIMLLGLGALFIFDTPRGEAALGTTWYTLREMLLVVPPIFLLLGLLDVWVPRETMARFMGDKSGLKGMLLALLIGSAAAGPLYAAFPVAAVLMKKGARFFNVVLFIGAWSTTKIPMVAFEMASLGPVFALTRLGLSIAGIFLIALAVNRAVGPEERAMLYARAEKI